MKVLFCDNELEKKGEYIEHIEFSFVENQNSLLFHMHLKTEHQADVARFVEKCVKNGRRDIKVEVIDDRGYIVKPILMNGFVNKSSFDIKNRLFKIEIGGKAVV